MVTFFSHIFSSVAGVVVLLFAPHAHIAAPVQPVAIAVTEQPVVVQATSSAPVVSKPVAKPVAPKPVVPKPVVPPPVVTPVAPPPPPATTTDFVIGSTTLVVSDIPLLSGGTVHAGETVPVSYLQITNTGDKYAILKGFWLHEDGSASTAVVIGLSTVDDAGGSRGLTGGMEGASPFENGSGFAPTDAVFAPGQMRLFTVKAILSGSITQYSGTQLQLNVTSIESSAVSKGAFPIHGTTWQIAQ